MEILSVKYTEHMKITTKILPKQCLKNPNWPPKVIRICVTDPYATDSSGDEEDEPFRRRVKKFINEIRMEKPNSGNGRKRAVDAIRGKAKATVIESSGREERKFRGVRRRAWGKYAGEIKDHAKKSRLWLGTYYTADEAAMVYDRAALTLHGSDAVLNFPLPKQKYPKVESFPGADTFSGENSRNIGSPILVFRPRSGSVQPSRSGSAQEVDGNGAEPPVDVAVANADEVNWAVHPTCPDGEESHGENNDYNFPLYIPFLDDFFNFLPQNQMLINNVIVELGCANPAESWLDDLPTIDSCFGDINDFELPNHESLNVSDYIQDAEGNSGSNGKLVLWV